MSVSFLPLPLTDVNVLNPTLGLDLLSVRKIPVKEKAYLPKPLTLPEEEEDPDVRHLLEEMRSIVLKDRDLHDKATKAFVSFVRAYSKHEASYVFRIKNLDLVGVAKAYGLLRLPKMPELKGKSKGWRDAEVDVSALVFIFSTTLGLPNAETQRNSGKLMPTPTKVARRSDWKSFPRQIWPMRKLKGKQITRRGWGRRRKTRHGAKR